MRSRPALLLAVAILLGCVAVGGLLAPSSVGQSPAGPGKAEARYQTVAVGNYIVVSDPTTGECWARLVQEPHIKDGPEKSWIPLGSPIKRK